MRRDYARYRNTRNDSKGWQTRLFIVVFLSILLSMFCYLVYKYKTHSIFTETHSIKTLVSDIKSFFTHKKISSVNSQKSNTEPKEEEVHFAFYTELPQMAVNTEKPSASQENPIKTDNKTTPPPAAPVKTVQYVVELGVFKDVNSASQARLSLLLNGFESEVVKFTENNEESYRVQQGPFSSIGQAKSAQKKFQRRGVESVVKKIAL